MRSASMAISALMLMGIVRIPQASADVFCPEREVQVCLVQSRDSSLENESAPADVAPQVAEAAPVPACEVAAEPEHDDPALTLGVRPGYANALGKLAAMAGYAVTDVSLNCPNLAPANTASEPAGGGMESQAWNDRVDILNLKSAQVSTLAHGNDLQSDGFTRIWALSGWINQTLNSTLAPPLRPRPTAGISDGNALFDFDLSVLAPEPSSLALLAVGLAALARRRSR